MHAILAARTDFSLGESILTVAKLVDEAKRSGATAVAITDHASVTGMIDFSNKAKKAGIKPIIGAALRLVDDAAWRPTKGVKKKESDAWFLTVYALTEAGMRSIFRLLTLANADDHYYYTAKLSFDDLYRELEGIGTKDLALVLGDYRSVMTHPNIDAIVERLDPLVDFLFVPLVPIDTPYFTTMNKIALQLSEKHKIGPIVVRPAFYEKGAADAAEIMTAVVTNKKAAEPWHKSTFNRDFHLFSNRDMLEAVKLTIQRLDARGTTSVGAAFATGLKNTDLLVDTVSYAWSKASVSLPAMAADEFAGVKAACAKGWVERFKGPIFGHQPTPEDLATVYKQRLVYELETLKKLSFSGYFLLVQDVVNYAKSNGILVGPGRGSVGGSLVAYLMGITDCDPIRFGLMFERFINADRIDLPDADLDFMSTRRGEIITYLVEKYGAGRVAGVSNFGTLAAASTIRDVGRVMGLSERDYSCSKLVLKEHGANLPLEDCRAVAEIDGFAKAHEQLWGIMTRVEGTMRSLGTHASGIVVGGVDLVERGVVERRKDAAIMCWDKEIVEEQGLIKMDILGLQTLDLIDLTSRYVFERTGKKIDLMRIPLDDPKVLQNFVEANTTGVFQFESGGMRRLLKELGSDGTITFDDVTAATALYRPGPMETGMMDSFYLRKQGREDITYDHPALEPILAPTYGVITYQEQISKISQAVAGYSGTEADTLRKIISKKKGDQMTKERGKFMAGCVRYIGATEEWAGDLFDKIQGFAGYGFNKSHAVEYSLISWQCMYLKTYHAVEFYAAALSLMDEDKLPNLLKDAALFGIEVGMPDINLSSGRFEILTDTKLAIPFIRIKGVAKTATAAIAEARKAGPFTSKLDFLARVNKTKCNITVRDALDKVGAFSRIEPGTPAAEDPIRLPDQIELLPGLISSSMPIDRPMAIDSEAMRKVHTVHKDVEDLYGLSAAPDKRDGVMALPSMGSHPKAMLVSDAPDRDEETKGFGWSGLLEAVSSGMADAGLQRDDFYWTGLLKRPKKSKTITTEEITRYAPFLQREIDALKPPVIVLLGSTVLRQFLPDFKGKASEAAGEIHYSKALGANLVIGFSPGEIYYAPEKQANMDAVFKAVAGLLS